MSFSLAMIFNDAQINWTCDRILLFLSEKYSDEEIKTHFALSGRAAAILQSTSTLPVENVLFITADSKMYSDLKQLKNSLKGLACSVFSNRILLYMPEMYYEIWFSSEPLDTLIVSGVNVQSLTQIPRVTL